MSRAGRSAAAAAAGALLSALFVPSSLHAQAPAPETPARDGPETPLASEAVAVEAAEAPRPLDARGARLIVLNRRASEAALVDPENGFVLRRFATGRAPREVAVSPDGRYAYVVNYGVEEVVGDGYPSGAGADEPASVTVLDLEAGIVRESFLPGTYRRLHGIRVSHTGKRLWLTAEADSGVVELDAHTGEVLMLWKTGAAMSHTLAISPESRKLFVANRGSDSITVIDRLTVVAHRIPTGRRPEGIDVSPDGKEVWVGNRGDHTITVIDARKQRPLATLPAGGLDPSRLRFSPDGSEVWVSNRESRSVAVFDARSRELIASVALEVSPLGLVFSRDGTRVYVGAPEQDRVVVVERSGRTVAGSFSPGAGPTGLGWSQPVRPIVPAATSGGQS